MLCWLDKEQWPVVSLCPSQPHGQAHGVGPTSTAAGRTLLVYSLVIPTMRSIKPFDLGRYG
eukprot:7434286-Prorocentrum_lima.AAC.1